MSPTSWLPIQHGSHFSIANIPFGIISTALSPTPRPSVAIGDFILDLRVFAKSDGFRALKSTTLDISVFNEKTLNKFAALGRSVHREVRKYLQSVFSENTPFPHILKDDVKLREQALLHRETAKNHVPLQIGTYTDFFAGKHHAENCGIIFRGPSNALQPNYLHLPVGYHSRASSVVVSGSPVRRPQGQILLQGSRSPILAASQRLDIETELGAFLCNSNPLGEPIDIDKADDYIFGYVLLNDWSARDIQAWEAVPLGPFNAKSFCSTISPWVVLPEALERFRCAPIPNETNLLPYLRERRTDSVFGIDLQVSIISKEGRRTVISRTRSSNLIYSFPQMIAHHTIGGCPLEVGDLLGSGTISGTQPGTLGSLLEMTQGGKKMIQLADGEERLFLEDGDTVVIEGRCDSGDQGGIVGFGECSGTIIPSIL
ncbi:Fumarylacetoacetase [Aspergillus pseudoustus]|uniref:Fumarylacetoacetase n=1 Tax=Aspergillus pseudoustus TaxID=1810923 RepID=A0ABR4JP94_9EURO